MLPTLALLACLATAPEAGRLQPSVTCQASPVHSYALYLPRAYQEGQLWPVLFVFSPSGNGAEAAGLFQAGAERLGWIVIASNDARNGPAAPIRAAQVALWKEAFDRYRADPRRVYAAGFSGGARMAMALAEDRSGAMVGLISVGAFGTDQLLGPGRLAHVLLCGEEDFNQGELAEVWERLHASRGRTVWMEQFLGGHQWAPADLLAEGMVFLHQFSGLQGRQARDLSAEAAFLLRRWEAARAGDRDLDRAQRSRRWRDLAALPGAPAEAEPLAQSLAKDPEVLAARSLERSFARRAQRLQLSSNYGQELQRLLGLAAGSGPEALDARRLLERERGSLEERCREALAARDWEPALKLARGVVALDDRGSRGARGGAYAAMALANLGRKAEALVELKAAFARGFRPSRPLADLPLLAPLRAEPAFQELQAQRRQEP